MRVLCIDNATPIPENRFTMYVPKEGEVYNVIDTREKFNTLFYRLEEIPFSRNGNIAWYPKELFIPLQDDEQESEELQEQETNIQFI